MKISYAWFYVNKHIFIYKLKKLIILGKQLNLPKKVIKSNYESK